MIREWNLFSQVGSGVRIGRRGEKMNLAESSNILKVHNWTVMMTIIVTTAMMIMITTTTTTMMVTIAMVF